MHETLKIFTTVQTSYRSVHCRFALVHNTAIRAKSAESYHPIPLTNAKPSPSHRLTDSGATLTFPELADTLTKQIP